MMLAWKMAACLAAGNTLVLKPAMVSVHFANQTVHHSEHVLESEGHLRALKILKYESSCYLCSAFEDS